MPSSQFSILRKYQNWHQFQTISLSYQYNLLRPERKNGRIERNMDTLLEPNHHSLFLLFKRTTWKNCQHQLLNNWGVRYFYARFPHHFQQYLGWLPFVKCIVTFICWNVCVCVREVSRRTFSTSTPNKPILHINFRFETVALVCVCVFCLLCAPKKTNRNISNRTVPQFMHNNIF